MSTSSTTAAQSRSFKFTSLNKHKHVSKRRYLLYTKGRKETSMRPEDSSNNTNLQVPGRPQASLQTPERSYQRSAQATADLTRSQISQIYAADPTHSQPVVGSDSVQDSQTPTATDSPYERTHSNENLRADKESWQQYHSAWQQYYQQYFYRYYAGHLQQSQQEVERHKSKLEQLETHQSQPVNQDVSTDEALTDIRSRLRSQVNTTVKKARGSRHFYPIMAAFAVMMVFGFLQYNRVLLANVEAYVSPGAIQPSNIIVDPNISLAVSPDPRLIIPKINVDVPVVWDARPDHDSQMAAMANGVAWFGIPGANSKPGQVGNTVLSGHSSSDWLDSGDYKFIFARLEQMDEGDTVYINYKSTRYTYKITKKEVVKPNDVQALIYETDKPMLTLITCVPLGTANNRLLVSAEQVSPSPSEAEDKPADDGEATAAMPGQTPTFIERIFGAN